MKYEENLARLKYVKFYNEIKKARETIENFQIAQFSYSSIVFVGILKDKVLDNFMSFLLEKTNSSDYHDFSLKQVISFYESQNINYEIRFKYFKNKNILWNLKKYIIYLKVKKIIKNKK